MLQAATEQRRVGGLFKYTGDFVKSNHPSRRAMHLELLSVTEMDKAPRDVPSQP
jgi:hypothetical protein